MTRVFDEEQGPAPDPKPTPEGPRLGLTTPKLLAVAALSGAVVGWFVVETFELLGRTVPVTPWSMSLVLLVIGALASVAAVVVSRRAGTPGALDPSSAVSALVLGKTIVLSGALLAGGHLAYALTQVGQWDAPLPRQRVLWGLVAVVCAGLFAVGGWRLEKACWVDPGADEPEDAA
ncbi:DUF3180 domain-containing protein [Aestuariimicrobium ganziense]|uniref:DUF3180 domain-containing protein n=1 Tax=Aestuariimicrobium ganziense TaxID=2773677 RepID=UPI001941960D|nr:DUF3180 domain-containing protein [Aestuariimicrobium ganziense]